MNRPPFEITDRIINLLAETVNKLGNLEATTNKKMDLYLRKASMVKTINSSCAIEANTLTEQQVEGIINGKRIIAPPNEILEVKNAYDAHVKMDEYDPYGTASFLKAHGILMKHLTEDAGRYRSTDVAVYDRGNIVHIGARPQFISGLMDDLFKWAKTSELNSIIKACVLHYEIETIHPFSDGNGRIGRLWQSVILCSYNKLFKLIPTETLVHANQQRYYETIEASRKENSSTAFIEFMLEMILRTMETFNSSRNSLHGIRDECLKNLTKNEKELLRIIISNFDTNATITAGRLCELTDKADSTIRNNLRRLTEERILIASGDNKGRKYVMNKDIFQ
ncbi:MAG: Fic family protein [Methanomassiliicoccaceae archaeon]|jgi:Fic family protein|nr:Fic family protein [Methanomassiliicoccaceae archaeon]